MLKKGPISKVEAFYIKAHYNKIDLKELSEDLNRPMGLVEKWAKKNIDESPGTIKAGDHFARSKGSVVMTENASTLSDSKRKRKVTRRQPCITKIKND